ncbi:MAG: type 1 glutamine amidotransferase [Planctomycetota bacterium]|nr:type 1 glutamine amidotransferase [Planctomycetota bacterium]
MSLLVFQHHADESPSRLGTILADQGHKLRTIKLHEGQAVPDLDDVDGIVSMGGPQNVDQAEQFPYLKDEMALLKSAHDKGLPIVGVCLGAQLIAAALGGKVAAMAQPEVGFQNVKLAFPGTVDTLYQGITWDNFQCHLHGQEVTTLPPGGTPLAGSKACKTQAFKVGLTTYAFQYHFEWDLKDLAMVPRDPMAKAAGLTTETWDAQVKDHYDNYRRRGDRLSETIATMLFPIDKRRRG